MTKRLELVLRESYFGFKTIKKMLGKEPKKRHNLREIVQSLSSLFKYLVMLVNQKLNMPGGNKERLNKVIRLLGLFFKNTYDFFLFSNLSITTLMRKKPNMTLMKFIKN